MRGGGGEGRKKDTYWEIKASVSTVLSGIVDFY